jgi:hypothetical protein
MFQSSGTEAKKKGAAWAPAAFNVIGIGMVSDGRLAGDGPPRDMSLFPLLAWEYETRLLWRKIGNEE